MIKVPITYEDFDNNTVTEDHYFHLSKSELIDMQMVSTGEALTDKLIRVGNSKNGAEIMTTFKEIIAAAYGQRVAGSGSEFFKDADLTERFMGSLAFDQLITNLLTDAVTAAEFVNGLLPKGLSELAAATTDVPLPGIDGQPDIQHTGLSVPVDGEGALLPWAFREPTHKELAAMTHPQMQDVYRRRSNNWKPPVPA
jgi:hypothetical protein